MVALPKGKKSTKSHAALLSAANIFKALGHPSRLRIVQEVSQGERCVQDLTRIVGKDISTVSAHLSALRQVGILKSERRGTQIFYSLAKPCIMEVLCCLSGFAKE